MKVIGLIGGMSWESSMVYYKLVNQYVKEKCGGLHSAKSLMYSLDLAEVEILQHKERWEEATDLMVDAARRLERGGADFLVICTNTMHRMADDVQTSVGIPLLHIADAAAAAIRRAGLETVGLLGTKFTMEQDFYRQRLLKKHGIAVLIPELQDRQFVHDVIYQELCLGKFLDESRAHFLDIIARLQERGAQGVVLGCTEIPLLVRQTDSALPLFNTMDIHAEFAVDYALNA